MYIYIYRSISVTFRIESQADLASCTFGSCAARRQQFRAA